MKYKSVVIVTFFLSFLCMIFLYLIFLSGGEGSFNFIGPMIFLFSFFLLVGSAIWLIVEKIRGRGLWEVSEGHLEHRSIVFSSLLLSFPGGLFLHFIVDSSNIWGFFAHVSLAFFFILLAASAAWHVRKSVME